MEERWMKDGKDTGKKRNLKKNSLGQIKYRIVIMRYIWIHEKWTLAYEIKYITDEDRTVS